MLLMVIWPRAFLIHVSQTMPFRNCSEEQWVGNKVGEKAKRLKEQFREYCAPGSGYRTVLANEVTHLCWPAPRRVCRVREAVLTRAVRQAPQELEGQAQQEAAFRRATALAQLDVSAERHFAPLGGGLLRSESDAARFAEASPEVPLNLVQRAEAPEIMDSQEQVDEDAIGGVTHRSRLDTPAVLKQRRLLAAQQLLSEQAKVQVKLKAEAKAMAKQCKRKGYLEPGGVNAGYYLIADGGRMSILCRF